jgi:hypothetical protein
MCDRGILALHLLADENTHQKYRQQFALPSQPYLIYRYILLKMWFLNSEALLSKVVGGGINFVTIFGFSSIKSVKITHLFYREEIDTDQCC